MSGPQKPREGVPAEPAAAGPEAGGLATALAGARARPPRRPDRRERSGALWVAVGAAAVAIILLATLLLGALYTGHLNGTPAGTSSTGGGSTAGTPSSFYGALPTANAEARAAYWAWPSGGQTPLVFAVGLVSPTSLGPIANLSRLGTVPCAPTLLSSAVPSLSSYGGSLTTGLASAWLFAFNPSGNTLVVVAVVNGTASMLATTVTNGACYNGPGSFSTVAVDSSIAAAAAGASSKSHAFFVGAASNHTAVSAEFYLVPPGYLPRTPMAPMWIVNDTTCALYGGPMRSGSLLTTDVNAATGALYAQSLQSVTC